jgi:hypothetical protein
MNLWMRVVAADEAPKGRIRLTLECGHETLINPTLPLLAIRRGLLSSRVPCPICRRIEAQAPAQTARERAEEHWGMLNYEVIVRPKPEYL